MKFLRSFVFVSLLIYVQNSHGFKKRYYDDLETIESASTALITLLEKSVAYSNQPVIDVVLYKEYVPKQDYIFEKLMEKNRGMFSVKTHDLKILHTRSTHSILGITLVVGVYNELGSLISNMMPLIFYCPDLTIEKLGQFRGVLKYPQFLNAQFIVKQNNQFIDLYSVAYFTANDSSCRSGQLVQTNRFLINESRWLTNEFLPKPRRNFHGCELVVSLKNDSSMFINFIEHENKTLETSGIMIDIIKEAAKTFNFSIFFNAVGSKFNIKLSDKLLAEYEQIQKFYGSWPSYPDLDFNSLKTKNISSDYIIYKKYVYLIPPGELYSDAEKLFKPLELEVWIATFVTIVIALLTVQIINRLSRQVQNLVFGRNVSTPSLNIMIAFVGGGQFTLPRGNFARILLMIFILFSLIIRTCHQSKLFEYLQADIIKSEIQSIDELIERNVIIYIPKGLSEASATFQRFKNKFVTYEMKDQQEIFEKTIDPKFDGAVLTEDYILAAIEAQYMSGATSLKVLKEEEFGGFKQFPHHDYSLLREQINELIGRLHSAGLIEYWNKKAFKFQNKPQEESEPTQLTMDHLKAGFVVSRNYFAVHLAHSTF